MNSFSAENPSENQRVRTDPVYLQRCIHESMRLHPSSPTAMRRPTCPFHTKEGAVLNKEETLVIDLMSANRDVTIFGEMPKLTTRNAFAQGDSAYGLSFGRGMHACIGINLAAGALPKEDTDPKSHQYGIITLTPDNYWIMVPNQIQIIQGSSIPVRFATTGLPSRSFQELNAWSPSLSKTTRMLFEP